MPQLPSPPGGPIKLGGGRTINERLLFVTRRDQLSRNVGTQEASAALAAISAAGQKLLELPAADIDVNRAAGLVQTELQAAKYDGVVLSRIRRGSPPGACTCLIRSSATLTGLNLIGEDRDQFVVWSDVLFGDVDGDTVAELPVSRIPDGRRGDVLLAALQAPVSRRAIRGGIRNLARPFADPVYAGISNNPNPNMKICLAPPAAPAGPAIDLSDDTYFMLHGSDHDATRFWGEDNAQNLIEAVELSDLPGKAPAPSSSPAAARGACVTPAAAKVRAGVPIPSRGSEASIAITYLQSGALAFVGCTGTHYSPLVPKPAAGLNYFGKPMHDAFWRISTRPACAQALFRRQGAVRPTNAPHRTIPLAVQ